MIAQPLILRVAIATPLRRLFDYLPADTTEVKNLQPGIRVVVPFGRRKDIVGVVVSIGNKSEHPQHKLKKINNIIDDEPIFNNRHLDLLIWASNYYHYPIGEVIFTGLPSSLRKNNTINEFNEQVWYLTEKGIATDPNLIKKAPKQAQILNYLQQRKTPVSESEIKTIYDRSKQSLLALKSKDLIQSGTENITDSVIKINKSLFKLNKDQEYASNQILNRLESDSVFLLDGLTGSGKTEVYMTLMESVIKAGKQCLILLPEIGLTPQQIQRFRDRFEVNIAIQHSGLSDAERTQYWLNVEPVSANVGLALD